MTDSVIVVNLRVSIARIAQAAGVESPELHVLGKNYQELLSMAKHVDAGWSDLAGRVIDRLEQGE